MAGYMQTRERAILDWVHPTTGNTQHVAYSTNGTSEAGIMARTAIGATGWAAATGGSPSVKSNGGTLTTAAASGSGTITHFAIFSAASGGTQETDWQALAPSRTVVASDVLTWAPGQLQITLD